MSKRLWDKGEGLNSLVHKFTVGNDPALDGELVRFDCLGSAAHACMLEKVGVLSSGELGELLLALKKIKEQAVARSFEIPVELEDCHTAIEAALTDVCGDAGKKIHTARSRNDQVLLAMRLYMRDALVGLLSQLEQVACELLERAEETKDLLMPGYTHMQPAMPSSVGMWLHAFSEHCLELLRSGLHALSFLDCNPLGAASGFGVPMEIDRGYTAELLGFSRVQRSPINVQNSRGRQELAVLRFIADVGAMLEKFAWDGILYSSAEYGFISLSNELTTGSSIMPQKRNPDVLELMRAKAARLRAREQELISVVAKLPSNYHRDFQLTKEPVITAVTELSEMLSVFSEVLKGMTFQEQALSEAMGFEVYATYDSFRAVRAGTPFREAYKETARRIAEGALDIESLKEDAVWVVKTLEAELVEARRDVVLLSGEISTWKKRLGEVEQGIFG